MVGFKFQKAFSKYPNARPILVKTSTNDKNKVSRKMNEKIKLKSKLIQQSRKYDQMFFFEMYFVTDYIKWFEPFIDPSLKIEIKGPLANLHLTFQVQSGNFELGYRKVLNFVRSHASASGTFMPRIFPRHNDDYYKRRPKDTAVPIGLEFDEFEFSKELEDQLSVALNYCKNNTIDTSDKIEVNDLQISEDTEKDSNHSDVSSIQENDDIDEEIKEAYDFIYNDSEDTDLPCSSASSEVPTAVDQSSRFKTRLGLLAVKVLCEDRLVSNFLKEAPTGDKKIMDFSSDANSLITYHYARMIKNSPTVKQDDKDQIENFLKEIPEKPTSNGFKPGNAAKYVESKYPGAYISTYDRVVQNSKNPNLKRPDINEYHEKAQNLSNQKIMDSLPEIKLFNTCSNSENINEADIKRLTNIAFATEDPEAAARAYEKWQANKKQKEKLAKVARQLQAGQNATRNSAAKPKPKPKQSKATASATTTDQVTATQVTNVIVNHIAESIAHYNNQTSSIPVTTSSSSSSVAESANEVTNKETKKSTQEIIERAEASTSASSNVETVNYVDAINEAIIQKHKYRSIFIRDDTIVPLGSLVFVRNNDHVVNNTIGLVLSDEIVRRNRCLRVKTLDWEDEIVMPVKSYWLLVKKEN